MTFCFTLLKVPLCYSHWKYSTIKHRWFCKKKNGKHPCKLFFSLCGMALILSAVPGPATSASPENLLEMQVIRPHPGPVEPESLGQSSALGLNKPSEWFWCSNWRTTEMWHLNSAVLYGKIPNWISLLIGHIRPEMVKRQRMTRIMF